MNIFIKNINGNIVTINDIHENDSILKLKYKIYDKLCIEPGQQRLIFAGYPLNNDKMVCDYGIKDGSTVHLNLQLLFNKS